MSAAFAVMTVNFLYTRLRMPLTDIIYAYVTFAMSGNFVR